MEFTRILVMLRRSHRTFRRRGFFEGRAIHGSEVKDIQWLRPDGLEMSDEEWETQHARCLGVYLAGGSLAEADRYGNPSFDDDFLLLFNAHHEEIAFVLPAGGGAWHGLLDTCNEDGLARGGSVEPGAAFALRGRSFALLTRARPRE